MGLDPPGNHNRLGGTRSGVLAARGALGPGVRAQVALPVGDDDFHRGAVGLPLVERPEDAAHRVLDVRAARLEHGPALAVGQEEAGVGVAVAAGQLAHSLVDLLREVVEHGGVVHERGQEALVGLAVAHVERARREDRHRLQEPDGQDAICLVGLELHQVLAAGVVVELQAGHDVGVSCRPLDDLAERDALAGRVPGRGDLPLHGSGGRDVGDIDALRHDPRILGEERGRRYDERVERPLGHARGDDLRGLRALRDQAIAAAGERAAPAGLRLRRVEIEKPATEKQQDDQNLPIGGATSLRIHRRFLHVRRIYNGRTVSVPSFNPSICKCAK